jgi:hypothetical protein
LSQRVAAAALAALAFQLLAVYVFVLLVLLEPILKISIPVPHALVGLLIVFVPVPIGAALGWWRTDVVHRLMKPLFVAWSRLWLT